MAPLTLMVLAKAPAAELARAARAALAAGRFTQPSA
jgi:hypothetical protein